MNSCPFCQIIQGKIPRYHIWEDKHFMAFLTIAPINPGHTLVIPKKHYNDIFEIEDKNLGKLMEACKPIAKALLKAFQPKTGKIGLMVAGLEVAHPHIHLLPIENEKDLDFSKARHDISPEELQINTEKITSCLT